MIPFFVLILSLIIIPLTTKFGLCPFLPDKITTADSITDVVGTKEFLAITFALGFSLFVITKKGVPPQINKWPAILLFFVCVHHFFVPPLEFEDKASKIIYGFSKYLPIAISLIYYLFFLSVQQVCKPPRHQNCIAKVLMWIGIISAGYVILQSLGLDDRQVLNTAPNTPSTEGAAMFSFFGHPNFAGTFIAICTPFAFYFRRIALAFVMIIAVILCQSNFSVTALACGLAFYLWFKSSFYGRILLFVSILLGISTIFVFHPSAQAMPTDSGRFLCWKLIIQDIIQHPIFGYGWGSFALTFNSMHELRVPWGYAHNEYLQFARDCGIPYLIIFFSSIKSFFNDVKTHLNNDEILLAFVTAFIIILVCALGQFPWQIEPHRYLTVMILGIIYSIINNKRRSLK